MKAPKGKSSARKRGRQKPTPTSVRTEVVEGVEVPVKV